MTGFRSLKTIFDRALRAKQKLVAGSIGLGAAGWAYKQPGLQITVEGTNELTPTKQQHFPELWSTKYRRPSTVMFTLDGDSILIEPAEEVENTKKMMEYIRENTVWEERDSNHLVAWYTDLPCTCDYEYDKGNPQPARQMPDWMLELRDHMMVQLSLPPDNPPNSCNMNWYKNGKAGIGAHSDDEELFLSFYKPAKIISFTLGAERVFEIWSYDLTKKQKDVVLANGSYMTMESMFQRNYKHAIPTVDEELPPRLNITWRYIKMHTSACQCSADNPTREKAFSIE